MIIRSRLSPEAALELNHKFQEYLNSFGETQGLARGILEQILKNTRKTGAVPSVPL
jgi:hypothetical protein